MTNTTTTTTTGVATLKKLQKECLTIDLTKVRLNDEWDDAPLNNNLFHTDKNDENPHIKFGGDGKRGDYRHQFINHPSQKWKIGYLDPLYRNLKVLMFQGGKSGRFGRGHCLFTNAQILIDKSTDEILGVLYVLDNDYLNEWLRKTIDPNIPNNYDELHTEKEFEVLITTTTFSTKKVKVVGRTYDECLEKMKQNDPMLDEGDFAYNLITSHLSLDEFWNVFSGMKTTHRRELISSYDEWVSLQDK